MERVIYYKEEARDVFYVLNCFDVLPNTYKINIYGEIRLISDNTIIRQTFNINTGYNHVYLLNITNIRKYSYLVHRLVCAMFSPQIGDRNVVNHKDSDRTNNLFTNLEWCTYKENTLHAIRMGTYKVRGEDNASATLTNEQVHHICKLMQTNMKYADILVAVGLEVTTKNLDILTKIKSKHIWSHISNLYDIPKTEYRTKQIIYSEQQLHTICMMIENGYSNRYISEYLQIDMKDKKQSDKFYKFIQRIRNRETYTYISQNYNW